MAIMGWAVEYEWLSSAGMGSVSRALPCIGVGSVSGCHGLR